MPDGIEKITIRLDGKRIELSLEQARKLYGELDKLFGPKAVASWRYWPPYPYPPYITTSGTWISNGTTDAQGGEYSITV